MKVRAFLLFGAPGSGKGTQGHILGQIPGFFHLACGDVFRNLDLKSEVGKAFLEYSSRGQLVPDDVTLAQWRKHLRSMIELGRFKPEIDHLVLDGIPRNVEQARLMAEDIEVKKIFYLICPDEEVLVERMQKRALKANRFDDANAEVIRRRLETYRRETQPVLDYYGPERVVRVDATVYPYEVLREILSHVDTRS